MLVEKKEENKVDNAIIMAAGLSSRFAPLSYEHPKALVKVKGEVLIERQIKQLKEAGIHDITIIVGYKKELFTYLIEKYNIEIVENPEYSQRNNHSSLYYVKEKLANTYICVSDNYFTENIFKSYVQHSFYSSVYKEGQTDEWVIQTDNKDLITDVSIGGENAWVMLGHKYFTKDFSKKFIEILESVYDLEATKPLLWESIYLDHIDELDLYIQKYPKKVIYEFDSLADLRKYDESYWLDTRSKILKKIAKELEVKESEIIEIEPNKQSGQTIGFNFTVQGQDYEYCYDKRVFIQK